MTVTENSIDAGGVHQQELKVLRGSEALKAEGAHVFSGQERAVGQGFRNVSKIWYDKTKSYEQGLEQLEADRAESEDVFATLSEVFPEVDDESGDFVFRIGDRKLKPTEHAVGQIGSWARTGTYYPFSLLTNPTDRKEDDIYSRDRQDAETLAAVMRNGLRRVNQNKVFLWRTRKDGTLRAVLTTEYARVDNRWFVEALRTIVPGGRLSHWRGDSDTIWGNVLIPDTIRGETDSDYGGMLSVGNSEIGERRVSSLPSIFRAICMNGCIWGQEKGEGIRFVHRGKLDLDKLFAEIRDNLNKQIPLLPALIDGLMATRTMAWSGSDGKAVFAEVALANGLTRKQAGLLLDGYHVERNVAPDTANTLFGVVAAVTRAGQTLGNAQWHRFDALGGELARYDADDWAAFVRRASSRKLKDVEAAFAAAA